MKVLSCIWVSLALLFDPVQLFFNGNFWRVFKKNFGKYGRGWILDLGCGTGELRRHIKPEFYLGIDINVSYIKYAKIRFSVKNTKFELGDIISYKPQQKFDTVFIISVVHHLSGSQLRKVCELLKEANVKTVVIIDGVPRGPLKDILSWLDAVLGGGEYFRSINKLENFVAQYFKIKESGTLAAEYSFYHYPYIVAIND